MTPYDGTSAAMLQALTGRAPGLWQHDACGITRSQNTIPALVHTDAYLPTTHRTRLLLIGGLSGQAEDRRLALRTIEAYLDNADRLAATVALSAIPLANPDGFSSNRETAHHASGTPASGYPPPDHYVADPQNPESRYLWRWVGMQAPDLVLEIRSGASVQWEASAVAEPLAAALQATPLQPADSLLAALGRGVPNGLGPIPGLRLTTPPAALPDQLERLWSALPHLSSPSPARHVLAARRARTALQIARLLATVYGHTLEPVVYTQGMAISGRLRLAKLDPTLPNPTPDIVALVEPYVSGNKAMFGEQAGTTALGGIAWGPELTAATGDLRYAELLMQIARRYQPGIDGGAPPPCDADFRTEDMCMNGILLGLAYQQSQDGRYLDIQTAFLRQAHIQQDNGLFWHCRAAPYFWGRGNGFAAMGYSQTLSYLPTAHPDRAALLAMHRRHLDALRQCQHPSGMYPQVLDQPGSYQEFTATCMIGYAIARGLRRGWLDSAYRAALERAWQGVVERIDDDGGVVDACTNTGVQANLRAYLERPAIFGRDDRSGAMALWFALEMARL